MSYYKIDGSILTDIADAIRSQNGTVAPILTTDMASDILSIPTGGDNGNFKLEIEAIDYYSLSDTQCSVLKPYCFYSDPKVTGVNFENVLTIGSSAFYNCPSLAMASFPKCEYVGSNAFYATSISEFNSPSCAFVGANAFATCRQLSEVTFGSLTKIDDTAFNSNCSALQKVTFEYCASIGSNAFTSCSQLSKVEGILSRAYKEAFANCSRLTSLNFESMDYIGTNTFNNTGFTSIELPMLSSFFNSSTFAGCKSLCSASFPILTAISNNTFDGCILLSDFYAPNLISIADYAFRNCGFSEINDTMFPLVTQLPAYGFYGNSSLTLVSHPSITTLKDRCFTMCSSLTTVNLPSLQNLGQYTFQSCRRLQEINLSLVSSIPYSCFMDCIALSKVSLGTGNITLSQGAFINCTSLSEITNLSYVTNLGYGALQNTALSEVNLPNLSTMSTSGNNFLDCKSLQTVSLGGTFGSIRKSAFAGCTALTSLYLLNTNAIIQLNSTAANVFNSSPLKPGGLNGVYGSIYVPAALYNDYLANASWAAIETSHPGTFVSMI